MSNRLCVVISIIALIVSLLAFNLAWSSYSLAHFPPEHWDTSDLEDVRINPECPYEEENER
jgi:hypothetical protein